MRGLGTALVAAIGVLLLYLAATGRLSCLTQTCWSCVTGKK